MSLPATTILGFMGLLLLILGVVLILGGLGIISLPSYMTIATGRNTWVAGIICVVVGIILVWPEAVQQLASTPTPIASLPVETDTPTPIPEATDRPTPSPIETPISLQTETLTTLSSTKPQETLSGLWLGFGYTCNGDEPPVQIGLEQSGEKIVAQKITGDDCVKASEITWMGRMGSHSQSNYPIQFDVQLQVSSGPNTELYFIDRTATIWDTTFITVGEIVYHQVGQTPPASFTFDLNGIWLGKGYDCPAGEYILLEKVEIKQTADTVTATKITGDNCVKAGEITWQGNITTTQGPTTLPVMGQVGPSDGSYTEFVPAKVLIVNEDLVIVYDWQGSPSGPVALRRLKE